jgi:hypothetical protein
VHAQPEPGTGPISRQIANRIACNSPPNKKQNISNAPRKNVTGNSSNNPKKESTSAFRLLIYRLESDYEWDPVAKGSDFTAEELGLQYVMTISFGEMVDGSNRIPLQWPKVFEDTEQEKIPKKVNFDSVEFFQQFVGAHINHLGKSLPRSVFGDVDFVINVEHLRQNRLRVFKLSGKNNVSSLIAVSKFFID